VLQGLAGYTIADAPAAQAAAPALLAPPRRSRARALQMRAGVSRAGGRGMTACVAQPEAVQHAAAAGTHSSQRPLCSCCAARHTGPLHCAAGQWRVSHVTSVHDNGCATRCYAVSGRHQITCTLTCALGVALVATAAAASSMRADLRADHTRGRDLSANPHVCARATRPSRPSRTPWATLLGAPWTASTRHGGCCCVAGPSAGGSKVRVRA
jgi:hypothetical protein